VLWPWRTNSESSSSGIPQSLSVTLVQGNVTLSMYRIGVVYTLTVRIFHYLMQGPIQCDETLLYTCQYIKIPVNYEFTTLHIYL
jgi:hypothetical protein